MPLTPLETEITTRLARREMDMIDDLALQVAIPTGQGHSPGLKEYRGFVLKRLDTIGATFTSIPGIPRPDWLYNPHARTESTPAPPEPIIIAKAKPAPPEPGLAAPVMGSGGNSGVRILIAGHLDTVHDPHGPFQKLTIAKDGKTATGPGVVDMKGGIVIALHALEVLHELKVPLNWTFLLNADEETGSFSSIPVLQREAANHDFGIALEPALAGGADGSLATERMGSGQFRVEVRGRSAHVGRSFSEGVSAVNVLAEIMLKLAAMANPREGVIVNVGPLQGSEVTNAVPDYAACWGNVRVKDAATGKKFVTMLDDLRRVGFAHHEPQESSDAEKGGQSPPYITIHHQFNRPAKPSTDAVMEFAHRARQAAEDLGQSLPFASTGGVCDGNILQSTGLPTLDTLGVRGGNLHRPDEWIEIASLVQRSQMLAVLLSRLA